VYFEESPPAEQQKKNPRAVLSPMFPWKCIYIFMKWERSPKIKKKRVVYGRGGSHTHAFS
jgi:hypothetical protein